jgi:diguanylate cyclase (GGDEF)-like protein
MMQQTCCARHLPVDDGILLSVRHEEQLPQRRVSKRKRTLLAAKVVFADGILQQTASVHRSGTDAKISLGSFAPAKGLRPRHLPDAATVMMPAGPILELVRCIRARSTKEIRMRSLERWRNKLLYDLVCLLASAAALWFVGVETGLYPALEIWVTQNRLSNLFMLVFMMSFVFLFAVALKSVQLRREIRARTLAEEQAKKLARHDALTGLANRRFLIEEIEIAAASIATGRQHALFLIDLDRFKPINDFHGHGAGDAVLCETAIRLQRIIGTRGVVARLGGDEFAIFVPCGGEALELNRIAAEINHRLADPLNWGGSQLEIGATVGFALMPADADNAAALLHCADLAMYRAKSAARGSNRRYLRSMDDELKAKDLVRRELRSGLAIGDIIPYYQPIVRLVDHRIVGFEALARWQHPRDGILLPANFIQAAEEAGLLPDLSYGLMRRACLEMKRLSPNLSVAVNISALQLRDRWMPQKVLAILSETGFPAHRLELEITETALMGDMETAQHVLHSLRNLGVSIALDDFGTGYSSLSYLRELCIDRLKIDRSFVHAMHHDRGSEKIVNAILSLSKGLGLRTTAEGIESTEEATWLSANGCELAQGYLFGRPMSFDDAARLLETPKPATAQLWQSHIRSSMQNRPLDGVGFQERLLTTEHHQRSSSDRDASRPAAGNYRGTAEPVEPTGSGGGSDPFKNPRNLRRRPLPAARRRDAASVERGGDLTKGSGPGIPDLADRGSDVGGFRVGACCADGAARLPASRGDLADVAAIASELHAPGLGSGQSGLRAGADHVALGLRDDRHDADDHFVRLRHVGGDEADTGLLQPEQEVGVAGEPIELGDNQRGAVHSAETESLGELRAVVVTLPALDLLDLGDELPVAAVEIVLDGLALCLDAETAAALLGSGDAEVADELALGHDADLRCLNCSDVRCYKRDTRCTGAQQRVSGVVMLNESSTSLCDLLPTGVQPGYDRGMTGRR